MIKINRVLRIGSIGAGISTIMIILLGFISLPAGMSYPGLEALTGETILSASEHLSYVKEMQMLFILDGIFLMGWILSWVGLAELVRSRYRIFGILTLIFGLAGAIFDLSENAIIWGVIQNYIAGRISGTDWIILWKAVQQMSYWFPFIGAIFAACALWSVKKLDQATVFIGTIFVAGAVIGLYLPGYSLLSNLWFLCWFACLSLLLWRRSTETQSNP
jgi:hypothetical protein